ncbi:MAG: GspH/FimT family pseudopilin [Burkholderiales bacterium]|nr:GspH/FimT family pseudopilin [Burkholderiales bacterium]
MIRTARTLPAARQCRGLTVIELMAVVAVVAVLAALAAPSLREMLARQRVAAINAELVTDLQYARSEAVARNREVYVSFRTAPRVGSPPMTCYTIHTLGTVGTCDCRKPPGTACQNVAELIEIKTVQVLATTDVAFVPPPSPGNRIGFTGAQGLAFWSGHLPTDADYSTGWQDFLVGVDSSISGKLRTAVGIAGRPQVCSPDGSISGATRCPE